jgi:low affinity Fe/Cu permease
VTYSRLLFAVLEILLKVLVCTALCPVDVTVGAGLSCLLVFNDLQEVYYQVLPLAIVSILTPKLIQLPQVVERFQIQTQWVLLGERLRRVAPNG